LRILEALGISFISSEGSKSITTTKINYDELLKMVNRMTKNLEPILNKYYQLICEENGFPIEYAPTITIQSTKLLDLDNILKVADIMFSKIGLSYSTVLNTLGLDYEVEKKNRIKENDEGADTEVFIPHANSYTSNSNDLINDSKNTDSTTNKNNSKKNENVDKQESDQSRKEALKV